MHNRDSSNRHELVTWAEMLDVLAALITIMLLAVSFLNLVGAPRVLLALAFTFFAPGRAIVSNWPRMANWSDVGMSIVLSLGLLILLATLMLWLKFWHPLGMFDAEALLSLIGLGVALARRRQVFSASLS